VQNSLSLWLITFLRQLDLLYWGFRSSNIFRNGDQYL